MARVYKRGKTWHYRVRFIKNKEIVFDKSAGGFLTKKEADFEAKKVELNYKQGANVNPKEITFYEYYSKYIKLFKMGSHGNRADDFYITTVKKVNELFGNTLLSDVTRNVYQSALNEMATTFAKATVKKYHNHFKGCLAHAVEEQILPFNPATKVVLKGNSTREKSIDNKFISLTEAKKLKSALLDERYHQQLTSRNICIIALETGMRFGEILAMTWDRLDWEKQQYKIDRSWDYLHSNTFKSTKTNNIRFIKLSNELISFLRKIKEWQQAEDIYTSNGLIMMNQDKEIITNNAVNKTLRKACVRCGIKSITLHSLRHTHGSILLLKGFSILYISKRLGHATVSTTQNVYLHILAELEEKEDNKIVDGIL
ncbi:site-specific integrase [Carnobacteriaceae bacterium zg-ZUI240]|nr:site-specific integrase [Carnobacteriaceae bacterium zg-ZUI240]